MEIELISVRVTTNLVPLGFETFHFGKGQKCEDQLGKDLIEEPKKKKNLFEL